jgi:predicted RNase H-like HicB family nuclease
MPDATHYTYRVTWSAEDGEHVATVAEFPSLSWLAPTPVEAYAGLENVVRDVLADLAESGEPVPEPLSEHTYSGKFMVRVPAEVHRRLAREAAEQHVSLNRLVSERLARALKPARLPQTETSRQLHGKRTSVCAADTGRGSFLRRTDSIGTTHGRHTCLPLCWWASTALGRVGGYPSIRVDNCRARLTARSLVAMDSRRNPGPQ